MRINISNIKLPIEHKEEDILKEASRILRISDKDFFDYEIKHKSIDARRKDDIKFIYSIEAELKAKNTVLKNKNVSLAENNTYLFNLNPSYSGRPIIIGAGPAGLFCAYLMVLNGLEPIVLERGECVDNRQKDINDFWNTGILKPDSNVQFGEGGAGTFSDGKLNTLVKDKKFRCRFVLETFVKFGAPANILYDSKPHVGTDILISVVRNMRNYICDNGGEIRFNSKVEKLLIDKNSIKGVILADGQELYSDRVVLAIGHSARDTFEALHEQRIDMAPKPFAVGFRVEHPRKYINKSQYGIAQNEFLPTAAYKLTSQVDDNRGVYTFCMCPGGFVVNASSENEMLAVNGMSYSKRDGDNSNTAVIITVRPEDFGGESVLSGIDFQRKLERKAYVIGNGKVPIQYYGSFFQKINVDMNMGLTYNDYLLKDEFPDFSYNIKGGANYGDLTQILSPSLNKAFVQGMQSFGKKIKNYDASDAILSGVESRTSSPIKIWRNDDGCSTNVDGLYPCGEGAGYAGGITSAAMDGLFIAEQIINS